MMATCSLERQMQWRATYSRYSSSADCDSSFWKGASAHGMAMLQELKDIIEAEGAPKELTVSEWKNTIAPLEQDTYVSIWYDFFVCPGTDSSFPELRNDDAWGQWGCIKSPICVVLYNCLHTKYLKMLCCYHTKKDCDCLTKQVYFSDSTQIMYYCCCVHQ